MADFAHIHMDPISVNAGPNLRLASYNGLPGAGNATVANVSDAGWWLGEDAGNTLKQGVSEGEVRGGGLMVQCQCSNGAATVLLNFARKIGKTAGADLTGSFANVTDADVNGNLLLVTVLASTTAAADEGS